MYNEKMSKPTERMLINGMNQFTRELLIYKKQRGYKKIITHLEDITCQDQL